jgi:hypothetical protein
MCDSACAGPSATLDEELITPIIDASTCIKAILDFANQFICSGGLCIGGGGGPIGPGQTGDVDVSTNGGASWTNVIRFQSSSDGYPAPYTKSVDITSAIQPNPSNVKIRFHYYNATGAAWWAIDNVKVRCVAPICNVCNP